jgi:hypothetical protein
MLRELALAGDVIGVDFLDSLDRCSDKDRNIEDRTASFTEHIVIHYPRNNGKQHGSSVRESTRNH